MGSAGPGKTQTPPPPSLPSDGKSEKRERATDSKKEREIERACLHHDMLYDLLVI